MRTRLIAVFVCLASTTAAWAGAIEARVLEVLPEARALSVEVLASEVDAFAPGSKQQFRVNPADLEIGYAGRLIRAEAAQFSRRWNLQQIFPLDGPGSEMAGPINDSFMAATEAMSRRDFVREGDVIPNFTMIDQRGDYVTMEDLRGRAFVLNFIFTRCAVPDMCPASSQRMAEMQDEARAMGLSSLEFVTITFDPEFDSPGVLRGYAQAYGLESDNFHLLTTTRPELIDAILRQFGILTIEENGTINHTMATLLVDASGRVALREEGPNWSGDAFLAAAREL